MSQKHFIKGTLILTVSGLICRVIGFFYRIFLSHVIGAQGMGLYQLTLPVQSIVLALTASGMQAVISRSCAACLALGQKRKSLELFWAGTFASFAASVFFALLIYRYKFFICAELLKEPRTENLICLIAFSLPPAVLHTCTASYYYARKQTVLPSCLQLLEQIARVSVCYLLFIIYTSERKTISPVIAAGGTLAGEIVVSSISLLAVTQEFHKEQFKPRYLPAALKKLPYMIRLSVPHSMNRLLLTILSGMEMILIPQRLRMSGLSGSESLGLYGIFTGMVLPLILFPSALTNSASVMLLPSVAELQALGYRKRIRYITTRVSKYCILLGSVCFLFFFLCGKPLGNLLFHNRMAGLYIQNLSFICPFLYLNTALTGILNGLGKPESCLIHNVLANSIRIGFVLFAIPHTGIPGYLRGILISEALLCFLHLRAISAVEHIKKSTF